MCAGTKREVISALLRLAKVPPGELAMLLSEAPLSLMLVGAPHSRAGAQPGICNGKYTGKRGTVLRIWGLEMAMLLSEAPLILMLVRSLMSNNGGASVDLGFRLCGWPCCCRRHPSS